MSKKKKEKEEKGVSILATIDNSLNSTYESIQEDIQYYQAVIKKADEDAEREERKKLKKNKKTLYTSNSRTRGRMAVIAQMSESGFFERIEESLKSVATVIIIIARLVASLILSILSFEPIKALIPKNVLDKMNCIYNVAMAIH